MMGQGGLGRLRVPRENGAEDPSVVVTGGLRLGEAHPVAQPAPFQPVPCEHGPVEQIDENRVSRGQGDGAVEGVVRIVERGSIPCRSHRGFRPAHPLVIRRRRLARGKPRQNRLESKPGREKMPGRGIGKFAGTSRSSSRLLVAFPSLRRGSSLDKGAPSDLPDEETVRLQKS